MAVDPNAPTPAPDEGLKDYMTRCMADPAMTEEYKDTKERFSNCLNTFNAKGPHAVPELNPHRADTP